MKIGIEAKRVFANRTGLGNACRQMVEGLATYFPEHEYHLYTPKVTTLFRFSFFSNIIIHTPCSFFYKKLSSIWRTGGGFVKHVKEQNIFVFHGMGAELPFGIRKANCKTVVTIYDLIFERYPHQYSKIDVWIHRKKMKYACQVADKVLAISQQTKQDLISFYQIPAAKIEVVTISIADVFFEATTSKQQQLFTAFVMPPKYALYVGSIIPRKGLLPLCKAMLSLPVEQQIPLVIIGKGETIYLKEIKQIIKDANAQHLFIFLNEHSNAHSQNVQECLPLLYKNAEVFIYPSEYEGFGLPVAEAMASGTPIITSNTSSMPEVAGNAGLCIEPHNEASLCKAIGLVLSNSILQDDMRKKGLAQAKLFTNKKVAQQLIKVYEVLNDLKKN